MKKALIYSGIRLGLFMTRLALSFLAAWIVSIPMIAIATAERGHGDAYGGEWFVIIGAFVLTFYLAGKALRPPCRERREKMRRTATPAVYGVVTKALRQLGYKNPQPKITPRSLDHFTVELGGSYFGTWDMLTKTFVD